VNTYAAFHPKFDVVERAEEGKIIVLGKNGQIGSALTSLLGGRGLSFDFPEIDFEKPKALISQIENLLAGDAPSALINAAAYTQVDKAEQDSERAGLINTHSPRALAEWAKGKGIPFVHYSTDYVYSGTGNQPRKEEEPVNPLNAYGRTKLEGDEAVQAIGGSFLIFRTSWVYDSKGSNFFRTMLRLGQEREELKVVTDQIGAPSYAPHLARATLQALEAAQSPAQGFPSGVYHLCNLGQASWFEFASAIFEAAKAKGFPLKVKVVEPIPTASYPTPAKRPLNSRLSTQKFTKTFETPLPHWQLGLVECMEEFTKK
jgi:dTDP-4-dehydrorhamnose reductase